MAATVASAIKALDGSVMRPLRDALVDWASSTPVQERSHNTWRGMARRMALDPLIANSDATLALSVPSRINALRCAGHAESAPPGRRRAGPRAVGAHPGTLPRRPRAGSVARDASQYAHAA